ncbi:MAG: DNA-3-methyladenine glycosylase I, partial [Bacteroidetes bacterium]|nr:DNA-3-methyladenine glycosylase I [Bacteroidota bacterium]
TILNKRGAYRTAYRGFDPVRVARFTSRKREQLLANAAIVRNRLKIESSVTNARAYLEIQREFGSFADFLWGFVGGKPIAGRRKSYRDLPTETAQSRALSRELKRRGFRFVGPTIVYAYMQAVGMVNDHEMDCFRHPVIAAKDARFPC